MKVVFAVFIFLFLSACASKSGFEPYEATPGNEKTEAMSYKIEEGDFSLSGPDVGENYPREAELKSDFYGYLKDSIDERGVDGENYTLRVSVEWERRMSGIKKDSVFSSAVCRFNSEIIKGGEVVAVDYGDPLNADSVKYNHKNFFNNLKRMADTFTQSGDADSEQRELKRCAMLLVERLPK